MAHCGKRRDQNRQNDLLRAKPDQGRRQRNRSGERYVSRSPEARRRHPSPLTQNWASKGSEHGQAAAISANATTLRATAVTNGLVATATDVVELEPHCMSSEMARLRHADFIKQSPSSRAKQ